ncbi:MAG: ABC transporter permease [Vicinamibacteria bacterium]|nr:ABC transporter permease [Vicinamibacteria bacterium]
MSANRLARDLMNAVRAVVRRPGFALIVIGTLTLGIGANAAIFSVINAALFRPLAVADEASLFLLQEFRRDQPGQGGGVSYPDFLDWKARSRSFSAMAIVGADESTLIANGAPSRVRGALVSADLFRVLGVEPVIGRSFRPAEELGPAAEGLHPLMLTYSAWMNRFNGDPAVIGRQIVVDERTLQVIGVTPRDLFPLETEPIDYWVTVASNGLPTEAGTANASRGYRAYAGVLARLAPGVTPAQARAELGAINLAIRAANPRSDQRIVAVAAPLREALVGDASRMLWLLLGVVGAVLLIACVNVANLLLARAATRGREIAIRKALGAGRGDITRQMLAESLVFSFAGGLAGLLVSIWIVRGIVALLPAGIPRLTGLMPDGRVLLFTFAVATITAVLCALLPALAAGRSGLSALTREGGRGGATEALRGGVRGALVVAEVALAMTLLVGAGLLLNSLIRLNQVDPGFDTRGTLTAQMALTGARYRTGDSGPDRLNQFLDALTERIRALPGVSEVSHAQSVPLTGIENNTGFDVMERPAASGEQSTAQLRFVGSDYFSILSIPVKAGRAFGPADGAQAPRVAIVNEAFVKAHFAGQSPLGRHLKMGWGGDEPKEIVGVVGDVRHRSLSDASRPEMYVPQAQFPNAGVTLLVRTKTGVAPESLIAPLRAAVLALDAGMPLSEVKTLQAWRSEALATPRFNTALLGGLSLLALLLTVVGLYGVMSYSVAQRAPEMGIRMAIGARAQDVMRMVLGEGIRLVAAGIVLGALAAMAVTRLMTSLLFDVAATDPSTFASIAALLCLVAVLACWVPARRATRVDPMTALRCE